MQAAAARNAWAVAVAVAWAEPHAAAVVVAGGGGGGERRGVKEMRCVCVLVTRCTVPQVTDGRFGGALNQKSVQTMQKQTPPGGQRSLKASRTIRESLLSYSPKKAVFSTEYSFYVFVLFERSLANFTVIASHVGLMA